MPSIAVILERFRRAGAPPGAAAPAGVPRDRKSELSAELAEVFGDVDAIEAEAQAIRQAGDREAERIRSSAKLQAQQIVDAARLAAPAARAQAEEDRRRERSQEMQSLNRDAEHRIASVRDQAALRMPALLSRVVAELININASAPEESRHAELVGRR